AKFTSQMEKKTASNLGRGRGDERESSLNRRSEFVGERPPSPQMVTVESDGRVLHSSLLGSWTWARACASENDAICSTMAARSCPALSDRRDLQVRIAAGGQLGSDHPAHGAPDDLLRPMAEPKGDYPAFLGRISPEKRPDRAIAIARRAGLKLKIAAKVDAVDRTYFIEVIEPLLGEPGPPDRLLSSQRSGACDVHDE
ncbi:MAG TPA: hypothetical protein VLE23_18010, partial [Geminicoccaceae bacterium]|nr:hypothetical protein [Geminicoccaceae bacterium]